MMRGSSPATGCEQGAVMREHQQETLRDRFATMIQGAWLITSPLMFGYRSVALVWGDMVSGVLIIVSTALPVSTRTGRARWGNCFVGLWLLIPDYTLISNRQGSSNEEDAWDDHRDDRHGAASVCGLRQAGRLAQRSDISREPATHRCL